jgi:hypothetical protein
MKKLLMLAAAAAAILPMTAQADGNASGAVTYKTTVANTCAIYKLAKSEGTGYTAPTYNYDPKKPNAPVEATVTFKNNELVDAITLHAKYHQERVNLGGFCNYKHSLRLVSKNGGLVNTSSTEVDEKSTFNRRINYEAYISGWGSGKGKASLNTTGALLLTDKSSKQVSGDRTDNVDATDTSTAQLKISTFNDTTRRWLAGDYEDVLTIKLGTGF